MRDGVESNVAILHPTASSLSADGDSKRTADETGRQGGDVNPTEASCCGPVYDGGGVGSLILAKNNDAVSAAAGVILRPSNSDDGEGRCGGGGEIMGDKDDDSSWSENDSGSDDEDESSSSAGGEENDDDDDDDDGLSEYERLRLRNIRRNEARLARLGLTSALLTAVGGDGGCNSRRRPRKKRDEDGPPAPRRSMPSRRAKRIGRRRRRLCGADGTGGKKGGGNTGSGDGNRVHHNGGGGKKKDCYHSYSSDSDESSVAPSPVKVTRTLRPQPHQALLNEGHLKSYLRTRRARRGRPRREEYVYACDEVCARCGGVWKFENDDDENKENEECDGEEGDVAETTRLIRCKDCRGAFHLRCMMSMKGGEERSDGGDDDAEDESGKSAAVASKNKSAHRDDAERTATDGMGAWAAARDPKRCRECEARRNARKLEERSSSASSSLRDASSDDCSAVPPPLEAVIDDDGSRAAVRVRVTLPGGYCALRARLGDGREATCYVVALGGGGGPASLDGATRSGKRKAVTWKKPLERRGVDGGGDSDDDDSTTNRIAKIVSRALAVADSESRRLRVASVDALVGAMESHPDRPDVQSKALSALAEMAWRNDSCGADTANGGCVELAIAAMERQHTPASARATVQHAGCAYFRALSYDLGCCRAIEKFGGAFDAVVNSIRWNPSEVGLIIEASGFLQNMWVVSPSKTARSILGANKRNDDHPELLPALLGSIRLNAANVDVVYSVLGLLSNVALNARGNAMLRSLEADAVALDAIRDHPRSPEVHAIAFDLLQSVLNVERESAQRQVSELVILVFKSMGDHPRDEMVQINGCQLLVDIAASSLPHRDVDIEGLLRGDSAAAILTRALESFPNDCKDLVEGLLHD